MTKADIEAVRESIRRGDPSAVEQFDEVVRYLIRMVAERYQYAQEAEVAKKELVSYKMQLTETNP